MSHPLKIIDSSQGFSCPATLAVNAAGGQGNLNIAGANVTNAGIQVLIQLGQLNDKFAEDCLTLNVWVPSNGEKKKAVLLWIYGGGFQTGSTSTPTYNGQHLAEQEDVIVVSLK
jgi:cholinesterase